MKKIGFKNFRKFENFPVIELGDVTYLVGKNNAGKSTMVKALILVIENLLQKSKNVPFANAAYFSFTTPIHDLHVDTYDRALNKNCQRKEISFNVAIEDFEFAISVAPADDDVLYSHLQRKTDRNAPISSIEIIDNRLGVALKIEPFVNRYILEINSKEDKSIDSVIEELNKRIADIKQAISDEELALVCDYKHISELNAEMEAIAKRRNILQKKADGNDKEKMIFNSLHLTYRAGSEAMYSIVREIDALENMASYDDALKHSRIASLSLGLNEKEKKQQGQYLSKLRGYSEILGKMRDRLNALLSSLDLMYIPAHLASQEMVLNSHSKDIFAKVVDTYEHQTKVLDRNEEIKRFITRWMDNDHFGIGTDFHIEEPLPGYYSMDIDTYDGCCVNVADMGMGTNQLMILLLHVANKLTSARATRNRMVHTSVDSNSLAYPTILIEEPEQNLHPNLQSKLAEFFYELATSKEYYIHFIVETHSEYVVRKTQVIVAGEEYHDEKELSENNPIKVLYFGGDSIDKPVYEMTYNLNGRFNESFGPGFYDAAGQLALKLSEKESQHPINDKFNWGEL